MIEYRLKDHNCQTFVIKLLQKLELDLEDLFFAENDFLKNIQSNVNPYTKGRTKKDFNHRNDGPKCAWNGEITLKKPNDNLKEVKKSNLNNLEKENQNARPKLPQS